MSGDGGGWFERGRPRPALLLSLLGNSRVPRTNNVPNKHDHVSEPRSRRDALVGLAFCLLLSLSCLVKGIASRSQNVRRRFNIGVSFQQYSGDGWIASEIPGPNAYNVQGKSRLCEILAVC